MDDAMDDNDELAQQIEEQVNEWSSNSNECFNIALVRGDGHKIATFQPEFTCAIFGDEEAIFGYQDLDINLSFRAHDLKPKLDISYGNIFPAQGDVRPTNIKEALIDFLPASAFDDQRLEDEASFQPPGQKIREYRRDGKSYEIWCASLADETARRLLENMQILVPMYIDGGSLLELDQGWSADRWKIFLLYEVDHSAATPVSPYTLAGYGTSYRNFTFPERQLKSVSWDVFSPSSQSIEEFLPSPDSPANKLSQAPDFSSPLELPARERLSQFLMLPPWHGSGHGQELYNAMFRHLTSAENVREFTVEDPNEKFDDLRDLCDLLHLRATCPEFKDLRINTDIPTDRLDLNKNIPTELIVPLEVRKEIMRQTKIMQRQFDRLVEMHTLSSIPPRHRSRNRITKKAKASDENDRAYYFWRLYAKQRLYIFNRDQLAQVEHEERVEKLESALDSVLEQYTVTLEKAEAKEKAIASGEFRSAETSFNSPAAKRKRRVIRDDDDEDEEAGAGESESAQTTETNGHKKARAE
ncbi:hypothetical protein AC579_573 [Pseudocercospora musae]|uniref:Histone acetyltransferase type B catalytic subunit n=1 Tax=Pseudocercospora musae TaxID=113226 RepID=A0A139ICM7_9PEZI|nr:hypothetical protein AC579_573 [Pseudocercospora musae]